MQMWMGSACLSVIGLGLFPYTGGYSTCPFLMLHQSLSLPSCKSSWVEQTNDVYNSTHFGHCRWGQIVLQTTIWLFDMLLFNCLYPVRTRNQLCGLIATVVCNDCGRVCGVWYWRIIFCNKHAIIDGHWDVSWQVYGMHTHAHCHDHIWSGSYQW